MATLPVAIIDVLDAPTLSVVAASGLEDTAIPLVITAGSSMSHRPPHCR